MQITARHRDAESRFRAILADAALPTPDEVQYEPESVVFLWHQTRAAVVVDLEPDGDPVPAGGDA